MKGNPLTGQSVELRRRAIGAARRSFRNHVRGWDPGSHQLDLELAYLVPSQPAIAAVRVASAMTALATIACPIVSFLDVSGRAVLSALGYRAAPEHRVTDEEIRSLMAEAETAGVIEPGERAMIALRHAARRSPRSSDHDAAP
jgi:Cyclin M transmembrane N-terminal domain